MEVASVVATTLVGAALVVAGSSKLASPQRWRNEALAFGAPRVVVAPLPWLELAIGAAVLVRIGLSLSVGLAFLVLLAFTVAIVANLVRGRRPRCACFGSWSSAPIGWRHVARNAVLLAACAVAVA